MASRTSGRPLSPNRALSDKGREFGVVTTDTDRLRLAALGRWYCLSLDHLTRLEVGAEHWHPSLVQTEDGLPDDTYDRARRGVRRRLAKLARVQENAGNHTGPLVGNALVHDSNIAWYCTRYGATAASLPWTFRSGINPMFAAHAWLASSVGMQVEALGYRVLSEREIATKIDRDGNEIEAVLESEFLGPKGGQQAVGKKPDVVVLGPDGTNYIAIEAERDRNRPLRTYIEKLTAYQENPAIRAVWYICGSETTQNRVIQAAQKVGVGKSWLRLRVAQDANGLEEIPNLMSDVRLMEDLSQFGPPTGQYPRVSGGEN